MERESERATAPVAMFAPARVAYFEANGWRAYYEHRWWKVLLLLVRLCQEQFHIPFPRSLVAAYYATRAAAAWVPVQHDERKVLRFYERFYRLAQRYSTTPFDPVQVAALELRYNDDHRRLTFEADKGPLLETMVALHAALFCLPTEQVRESAEWRVSAMNRCDQIVHGQSSDIERDWTAVEEDLRRCYAALPSGRRGLGGG
jgi:hypothetical protein